MFAISFLINLFNCVDATGNYGLSKAHAGLFRGFESPRSLYVRMFWRINSLHQTICSYYIANEVESLTCPLSHCHDRAWYERRDPAPCANNLIIMIEKRYVDVCFLSKPLWDLAI